MLTPANAKRVAAIVLLIISYIAVFFGVACWKYFHDGYNAMDLAIFTQTFSATINGSIFGSSIHPPSYFADHISPLLFIFIPFYKAFPHPLTLVGLQIIAAALCAWPIWLIATKKLAGIWPITIVCAWLINPLLHNTTLFEFHTLTFAMLAILWSAYYFHQRRFGWFAFWFAVGLLAREDMALILFGFGIIAWLEQRPWRWRLVPLLLAAGYFIVATHIEKLFGADGYKFSIYYSWWQEFIPLLTSQPLLLIRHFINIETVEFLIMLGLPLAFIPLAGRRWGWLLIGPVAQFALGGAGLSATLLQLHYGALFLPALFCGLIAGVPKAEEWLNKTIRTIGIKQRVSLVFVFILTTTYTTFTLSPLPKTALAMARSPRPTTSQQLEHSALATIPATADVAATYDALTLLAARRAAVSFNYVFLGKQQFLRSDYTIPDNIEYIALDYTDWLTYQAQYEASDFYRDAYNAAIDQWPQQLRDFAPTGAHDSLVIYQRRNATALSLAQWHQQLPTIEKQAHAGTDENQSVVFLGYTRTDDHYELFWQIDTQRLRPASWWHYYVALTNSDGSKIIPLGYGLLGRPIFDSPILQMNYYPTKKNQPLSIQTVDIEAAGIDLLPWRTTHTTIDQQQMLGDSMMALPLRQE